MKPWLSFLVAISICALFSSGCRREKTAGSQKAGLLQTGALYSLDDGEGGYRAGKIIAVEDDVTFVHLFANRWTKRPALADARKASEPAAIAFTPETLAGMQPTFLANGSVSEDESQAYDTWKQSKRELF
jgi:hypothetical protein